MSCKSAFRISGGNIARSSAQERNQMLIEKLLPQWLSTMAKEHFGKRAIFRIVERFISHTPIFLPVINGIGGIWWHPDPELSALYEGLPEESQPPQECFFQPRAFRRFNTRLPRPPSPHP